MVKYINKKNPNYKRGTSYPEQFIYRCLVQVFDALNRIKDSETGLEFDIEIRELNLRIEYSGEYWHQNSIKNDNLKRKLCYHKGIEYIEIIELASKHETIIKEEGGYTLIIVGVESNFLRRNTKLIDIVDYIMKKYGYSLEVVDIERAIYEALACTKQYKYDIIKSADNLVLGRKILISVKSVLMEFISILICLITKQKLRILHLMSRTTLKMKSVRL